MRPEVFAAAVNCGGSVKVTLATSVHPWLLVTVAVYVPGAKLLGLAPEPLGDQAYVYGPEPPLGAAMIAPLLEPKHVGAVGVRLRFTFTC